MASIIKPKPYRYVLIHHKVCAFLDRQASRCHGQLEEGGILIGSYRGPHMEITDWTEPGKADASTLTSFIKRDPRHQIAALTAWRRSAETMTYLGEWHTHPYGDATPSGTDRTTWEEIAKSNRRRSVFILVSPSGWGVFLVVPGTQRKSRTLTKIEEGELGSVFSSDEPATAYPVRGTERNAKARR